ncbi:cytochrome c oxidase subunit 7A2, mitochondrial, partial [Dromiciops gliroides]|uniref:cytochrome c oxidase subunit 7A2, mitochondrial n=1 Tax=Dromiciops gliroides TaxID=33562 RepID=UPI001CC6A5BA
KKQSDACAGERARAIHRGKCKCKFQFRFVFRYGACPCRAFSCRSWWGAEVAKMLRNLLALRQIPQRTINVAPVRQFKNKVPEKQKLFQEDDSIPVHLKGGVGDALLYRATMLFSVVGTAYALYQLGMASFPKKKN